MKNSLVTKRLALVILMVCVGSTLFAGGLHTESHNSIVTLEKNYEGAGEVYVHYTTITDELINRGAISNEIEYSCKQAYGGWFAFRDNDIHVHIIKAVPSDDEYDYLWDGWYEEYSTIPFLEDYSGTAPPIDAKANDGKEYRFLAKWLYPRVTAATSNKSETIDNQDENIEFKVDFVVSEAKSSDNFEYNFIGDGFHIISNTAEPENYPTTITVALQYEPNGIHTASSPTISRETHAPSNCIYTTTSKYHGDTDEYSSKTCTWEVKEDYTPWFDIASAECLFDPIPVNASGTGIASGSIAPSDWNYAADQAYPEEDDGSDQISNEDNFLKNGCIWKVKLENSNGSCFSINKTDIDEDGYYKVRKEELFTSSQNLISFTPPDDATTDDVYTANLYIKCEYYDAVGNVIVSKEKNGEGWGNTLEETVLLKGQALLTPSVLFGSSETATLFFNNVLFASTPLKYHNGEEVAEKVVYYTTNITDIEIISEGSEYFSITSNKEEQSIKIELREDITPGQHQAIIYVKGTYEEDGVEKTKTATLTITADVVLDDPILEGHTENNESAGKGEVVLKWTSVPGATGYTLYYKEGDNIQSGEGSEVNNITSTSYRITNLTYDHTYSFIVVAHYGDEESLNTVSNVVTLRPTDFPSTIIWANRVTSLYTGTEKDGNSHPYMTKRKVDLTAAFDATSQNALFDYVVIFGKTEGDNSNNVTYSNANTPCYVYEKSDAKTYTIRKMGKDNYVNMNRTTKHPGFTIDATEDSDKQMSIYITGYCPYASTGTTWEENAVMHITGNGGTSVDVYLDNTQIYARSKSANGTTTASMSNVFPELSMTEGGYIQGSGAVLTFTSTSGTFRPKVHLLGENVLQSCEGMTLEGEYYSKEGSWPVYYENHFSGTYTQASSPIQALPTNLNSSVIMTIDNKWETSLTAGRLELRVNEGSTAPLIDLGNEYSKVIFEGGYIVLQNIEGRNIASYRKCVRTDSQVSTNQGNVSQTRTIYGASKATGSGKNGTKSSHDIENKLIALTTDNGITFNDGTFNATHPITVPATTEVNGGSYNCAFAHSPIKNRYGKIVQKIELSTTTIAADMGDVENSLITFQNSLLGFKKWMDEIFPEANWQDSENPVHYASVSSYYDGANKTYGYSSLMPDADGKVYLMLPKDGTPTIKQWAIAGPSFDVTTHGTQSGTSTIHCTVQKEANTFGKTHKMLYFETDKYTKEALKGEGYSLAIGGSNTVNITSNLTPAEITNNNEYIISDKVYIMKPIVATDWILFCPPFDVANVYIVEAYPERQLISDYKGEGTVTIKGETNIANARKAQAQRFMDLYLWWYNHGEVQGLGEDFYDGNDLGSFVYSWAEHEASSNANYTPVINQLYHYTGDNGSYPEGMRWYDAHYYLYESVGSWTAEFDGATTETGGGTLIQNAYKPTWNVVTTQSGNNAAIMKAGKVYALNFPYNVIGGHNPETTWDYWTGKYIIIESTIKANGHTIPGKSYDWRGIKTVDESTAWMCGNPTFASNSVTDDDESQVWSVDPIYGYTKIEENEAGELDTTICVNGYQMVRKPEETIKIYPTKGFVLADPNEPSGMRARTINYQTGEVTYETIEGEDDNDDPGVSTGIPTIMGDVSILVIPTDEGLTIIPREPQQVMLYNAEGKLLFSQHLSAEEHINVPTGAYIVRGEHNQVKAIKK